MPNKKSCYNCEYLENNKRICPNRASYHYSNGNVCWTNTNDCGYWLPIPNLFRKLIMYIKMYIKW